MTITKKIDGDTLTIAVEGWLDTMTSPAFHQEVEDLGAAKNVVLDFKGLEYISSAGLRETVELFRAINKRGGAFSVRNVDRKVMDVFTLTGFDKKFEIRAD